MGEQFTLYQLERHTFPPFAISQHSTLQVSVTYLPRLKQIPPLLLGDPTEAERTMTELGGDSSLAKLRKQPQKTRDKDVKLSPPKTQVPDDLIQRTSELCITKPSSHLREMGHSPSRDGFPFSPPQPSPMSPKLLSGLADKPPYNSLLDATKLSERKYHRSQSRESHTSTNCLQHFCFERTCVQENANVTYDRSATAHASTHASSELRTDQLVAGPRIRTGGGKVYRRSGSCCYPDSMYVPARGVRPPMASSPVSLVSVCP